MADPFTSLAPALLHPFVCTLKSKVCFCAKRKVVELGTAVCVVVHMFSSWPAFLSHHSMMWENHSIDPSALILHPAITYESSSPVPQPCSLGFTKPGREGTVKRSRRNQCTPGTLHKPHPRVAAKNFPQSPTDLRPYDFIFYSNNSHQLP